MNLELIGKLGKMTIMCENNLGKNIEEYGLEHRPGNPLEYPDEVATVDKISTGDYFPKDYLENTRDYLPLNSPGAKETINILKALQGCPDAEVIVYRAAPSNGKLNTGDWVTLSLDYARQYDQGGAYCDNEYTHIFKYRVLASELSFDGDDICEFGYWGKEINRAEMVVDDIEQDDRNAIAAEISEQKSAPSGREER